MLFAPGGRVPNTMDKARRMSENLAPYETKTLKLESEFDHARVYSDLEAEVSRMKQDLGCMDTLLSGLTPFHQSNTSGRKNKMTTQDSNNNRSLQPQIVAHSGKQLVNLDVSAFRPDELAVRAVGLNTLEVLAEHYEKNGLSESHRKLRRHFEVPPGVDINSLVPTLTPDGRLVIDTP